MAPGLILRQRWPIARPVVRWLPGWLPGASASAAVVSGLAPAARVGAWVAYDALGPLWGLAALAGLAVCVAALLLAGAAGWLLAVAVREGLAPHAERE